MGCVIHRARTKAPGAPPVAPEMMAGAKRVQAGSCSIAKTTTRDNADAETITAGYITRRWPWRSTRLESTGGPERPGDPVRRGERAGQAIAAVQR